MSEKVIVIGGTAAGLSAASRFRKLSPEAEIVVYERSGYISYGSCGLPYFVGGMIGDPEDLVSLSMEEAADKMLSLALDRGGRDNISLVITEVDA